MRNWIDECKCYGILCFGTWFSPGKHCYILRFAGGIGSYHSYYFYDNNCCLTRWPAWDNQDDKTAASKDEIRNNGKEHVHGNDAVSETTTSKDSSEMEMISLNQALISGLALHKASPTFCISS
jgi:hypothetical protein